MFNSEMNRSAWVATLAGAIGVSVSHAQVIDRITPADLNLHVGFGLRPPVPDVDGDGTDELLVGIDAAGGGAFLLSGRTGSLIHAWSAPEPDTFAAFGSVGTGIGDLDGDGAGDVVIGDYYVGRAYVLSGRTGALIHTLRYSTANGGFFGISVAAMPDVDADGYPDIAVGSSTDGGTGLAYVFSGRTGAELHRIASPTPSDQGKFGASVAGLDDVDGDGFGDLLVGAPFEGPGPFGLQRGQAHVFSGATGAPIRLIESPQAPAQFFGQYLARLPDINADGFGDFMIGAPRHRGANGLASEGALYLFSGHDGSLIRTLRSPHEAWLGGQFGNGQFTETPDLDRDGVPDILVGQPNVADTTQEPIDAGRLYLFSGATGALRRTYRSPLPNPMEGMSRFGVGPVCLQTATPGRLPDVAVIAGNDCGGACGCNCTSEPRGVMYIFRSCPVDLNFNGSTESGDFFAYLSDFFAVGPYADFNADGFIDSQDFFAFLAGFFAGC